MAARLAQDLELKRQAHEKCIHDHAEVEKSLGTLLAQRTTEIQERVVEKEYTDYVTKKVRKVTTETPHVAGHWR